VPIWLPFSTGAVRDSISMLKSGVLPFSTAALSFSSVMALTLPVSPLRTSAFPASSPASRAVYSS
jgi:hypothetical protein